MKYMLKHENKKINKRLNKTRKWKVARLNHLTHYAVK